jgi:hypothetical protein
VEDNSPTKEKDEDFADDEEDKDDDEEEEKGGSEPVVNSVVQAEIEVHLLS